MKDSHENQKTSLTWEEIFPKDISDTELLFKVYKELFKLTHKETNNLVFKMGPKSTSHQRRYTDGKKHMKRQSIAYVISETQIKTMRYHYILIRMTKIQNSNNTKCW